jgi:hypothetical protein
MASSSVIAAPRPRRLSYHHGWAAALSTAVPVLGLALAVMLAGSRRAIPPAHPERA